jgi:hypothetical protein
MPAEERSACSVLRQAAVDRMWENGDVAESLGFLLTGLDVVAVKTRP